MLHATDSTINMAQCKGRCDVLRTLIKEGISISEVEGLTRKRTYLKIQLWSQHGGVAGDWWMDAQIEMQTDRLIQSVQLLLTPQSLPCLFCHVQLVNSGQLVQMGLEHGLHLVPRRRGESGRGLLPEGHSSRGGGDSSDGRGGDPLLLLLQLVLQALVKVGLHGHGGAPTVTLIPGVRRDVYCTHSPSQCGKLCEESAGSITFILIFYTAHAELWKLIKESSTWCETAAAETKQQ